LDKTVTGMAQQLVNTWIGEIRGKRLFKSHHYFIEKNQSLCGQCKIWREDEKHLKPLKFDQVYQSKICKRCIFLCELKRINYKI